MFINQEQSRIPESTGDQILGNGQSVDGHGKVVLVGTTCLVPASMNEPGATGSIGPHRPGLPSLVRMAALSGVEQTIIRFLRQGGLPGSVDEEGRSLLHLAASRGRIRVCQLLFEAGASPWVVDKNGNDLLGTAIKSGSSETVALIREYLKSDPCLLFTGNGTQEEDNPSFVIAGAAEAPQPACANHLDDRETSPDISCLAVRVPLDNDAMAVDESGWVVEEDSPLPDCLDESCQSSATAMHSRITRHRAIDHDQDWSDIEIVLPVVRRGNLQFSALDEEILTWISRLLKHGNMYGWVPSHWLASGSAHVREERDRVDICLRVEMLLGEHGIQVEDEPVWSSISSDEILADASDLPLEVLSFLDDLGPGTRDPLLSYFRDLSPLPLLDWDQERILGRMWQGDRNPEGIRGLVEGNLRFVVKEARKFQGLGLDIQDLVNEGNLGLLEAASRFDPERENRFLTYAAWWIKQSIFHALAEQGGRFRLPQKVAGTMAQLNRIVGRLADDLGREPNPEEVAAEGTFSGRELDRLLAIRQTATFPVFDEDDSDWRVADGQTPCMDPGPDDSLDKEEFEEQVRRTLTRLNDKEQDIITRHFGLFDCEPETLEAIGQSLVPRISRERVRQIEERALNRIRDRRRGILGPYLEDTCHTCDLTSRCRHPLQEDEDDLEPV
ncbi:MAG: sigma-70 family RNA polymerase sigma factor [Holophaga sp.]|nr:sigma-70 family RNA polymerase sigma factor [Holophaga sp.]